MKKITLLTASLLVAMGLFANGNNEMASDSMDKLTWETETEDGVLPGVNPLNVTGDIITAGSSTVFPLSEAMAERFTDEGYPGNITVDSIGSGAGFERFTVTGETDISNASRGIKDTEIEAAQKIGRNPIEFRVGTDALAVTVSKSNTFAQDISLEDLAKLFLAENWSDVNPEWPNEKILKYIPGTDSGTFDYFVEEVFAKDSAPLLSAPNVQMSEDDNILAQGIMESPYGVGFFGYAYYAENEDNLNILSIDGIAATKENVDAAKYPLARPLFIYSDAQIMHDKPQVAAFIAFYLAHVNDEIVRVGYFPAHVDELAKGKAAWLEAMNK